MKLQEKRALLGIDLFAGAGGLSLGFEEASFKIVYALEKDKYAAETYRRNRNNGTLIEVANILEVKPSEVLRKLRLAKGDLDVVLGGPPCQGFSIANMRSRNNNNPANQLVFTFSSFVRHLMPKWFVMENVAGLNSFNDGEVKEHLLDVFRRSGYNANAVILDASCFGVPQKRKRIFVIGNRINKSLNFIHDLHTCGPSSYVTVRDAMDDLPILSNGNLIDPMPYSKELRDTAEYQRAMRRSNNKTVFNNLVSRNNDLVVERYRHIEQGENWRALAIKKPELLYNYGDLSKCHEWIYLRLRWDKPSVVISNYRKNMLIHPEQDRGLSVREAARLQSFPDQYVFCGPIGFQQQQVANAVPPLLGKSLATAILNAE